jgi:CheY-like chemotaxis protein
MAFVLVLDDDADLRETVSGILADAGYSVCTARDGAAALDKLRSLPVHLVLMDYAIPAPAHGEAFLRAKAADPRFASIPVILMSGYRVDGEMDGVAQVLPKPFDAETMLNSVRRLAGAPHPDGNGS